MQPDDTLMREASTLAETLRRRRAQPRGRRLEDAAELAELKGRLDDLWTRIRASRVPTPYAAIDEPTRRTRPKWD